MVNKKLVKWLWIAPVATLTLSMVAAACSESPATSELSEIEYEAVKPSGALKLRFRVKMQNWNSTKSDTIPIIENRTTIGNYYSSGNWTEWLIPYYDAVPGWLNEGKPFHPLVEADVLPLFKSESVLPTAEGKGYQGRQYHNGSLTDQLYFEMPALFPKRDIGAFYPAYSENQATETLETIVARLSDFPQSVPGLIAPSDPGTLLSHSTAVETDLVFEELLTKKPAFKSLSEVAERLRYEIDTLHASYSNNNRFGESTNKIVDSLPINFKNWYDSWISSNRLSNILNELKGYTSFYSNPEDSTIASKVQALKDEIKLYLEAAKQFLQNIYQLLEIGKAYFTIAFSKAPNNPKEAMMESAPTELRPAKNVRYEAELADSLALISAYNIQKLFENYFIGKIIGNTSIYYRANKEYYLPDNLDTFEINSASTLIGINTNLQVLLTGFFGDARPRAVAKSSSDSSEAMTTSTARKLDMKYLYSKLGWPRGSNPYIVPNTMSITDLGNVVNVTDYNRGEITFNADSNVYKKGDVTHWGEQLVDVFTTGQNPSQLNGGQNPSFYN